MNRITSRAISGICRSVKKNNKSLITTNNSGKRCFSSDMFVLNNNSNGVIQSNNFTTSKDSSSVIPKVNVSHLSSTQIRQMLALMVNDDDDR
ncbi:hypothetical protein ABK040_009798 [Willaertia magna]